MMGFLGRIRYLFYLFGLFKITYLNAGINIVFDYRYDTLQWFGNEQRYILDQAAYAWETRLNSESFASLIPEAGKLLI